MILRLSLLIILLGKEVTGLGKKAFMPLVVLVVTSIFYNWLIYLVSVKVLLGHGQTNSTPSKIY